MSTADAGAGPRGGRRAGFPESRSSFRKSPEPASSATCRIIQAAGAASGASCAGFESGHNRGSGMSQSDAVAKEPADRIRRARRACLPRTVGRFVPPRRGGLSPRVAPSGPVRRPEPGAWAGPRDARTVAPDGVRGDGGGRDLVAARTPAGSAAP